MIREMCDKCGADVTEKVRTCVVVEAVADVDATYRARVDGRPEVLLCEPCDSLFREWLDGKAESSCG